MKKIPNSRKHTRKHWNKWVSNRHNMNAYSSVFVHFTAVIAISGKGASTFALRFIYVTLNLNQALLVEKCHYVQGPRQCPHCPVYQQRLGSALLHRLFQKSKWIKIKIYNSSEKVEFILDFFILAFIHIAFCYFAFIILPFCI